MDAALIPLLAHGGFYCGGASRGIAFMEAPRRKPGDDAGGFGTGLVRLHHRHDDASRTGKAIQRLRWQAVRAFEKVRQSIGGHAGIAGDSRERTAAGVNGSSQVTAEGFFRRCRCEPLILRRERFDLVLDRSLVHPDLEHQLRRNRIGLQGSHRRGASLKYPQPIRTLLESRRARD